MKIVTFKIKGMTCNHCATSIEKRFEGVPGIVTGLVSYSNGTGRFEYLSDKISKNQIAGIINNTGHYKVVDEVKAGSGNVKQFDLIIIGGGSAAFSAAIKAESLGLTTLMVNSGLDFGGTCVNVGCVPSKNLIRAGEAAYEAAHSNFEGVRPRGVEIDFPELIKFKKKLVSSLQQQKYLDVVSDFKGFAMLKGNAEFVDENTILVDGIKQFKGLKILIATGSSTYIPEIKGLADSGYLTHKSLFDLSEQPKSMIVLGGGYVALEIAQAYHRLGTKVTVLQRSGHILSNQPEDVSEELEKHLQNEGVKIVTGLRFIEVFKESNMTMVVVEQEGDKKLFQAEKLLVATGTKANTSKLFCEQVGLKLTDDGHVAVNNKMETNLSGVYAAGDVANTPAYVYTAAYEGKIAVENAFSRGANQKTDYAALPRVVFTDPQVAVAGLTARQAEKLKIPYEVSKIALKHVPRAIVANDTRGFIKLVRNKETDKLIGAAIVAHEGGELIQQLSMAIKYGITITNLAGDLYPYLTLSEGIKLAAIAFRKDVSKLSCCAG